MTFWHLLEDVALGVGVVGGLAVPFLGEGMLAAVASAALNGGMMGSYLFGEKANSEDRSAQSAYDTAYTKFNSLQDKTLQQNSANQTYNSGLNAAASGQQLTYTSDKSESVPVPSQFSHFWGGTAA